MLRRTEMTKARIKLKLTQSDIANKLGVTSNHIAIIERGESPPSWELAIALCKILKIKLDDLAIIK
jgi:DNA-binding XRE family transcriptional regulator